jgi:hypothetical protein
METAIKMNHREYFYVDFHPSRYVSASADKTISFGMWNRQNISDLYRHTGAVLISGSVLTATI